MLRLIFILISTSLVFMLSGLMHTGIGLFLPEVAKELRIDPPLLKWIFFAPKFINAVLLLPLSMLFDRFRSKRVFTFSLLLFLSGVFFCLVAKTPHSFIIGRLLQGFGGAMILPGAYVIAKRCSDNPHIHSKTFYNLFLSIGALFLILHTAITGFITQSLGWRWVFIFMLSIGLIALCLLLLGSTPKEKLHKPKLSKILFCSYIVLPSLTCIALVHFGINIYSVIVCLIGIILLRKGLSMNIPLDGNNQRFFTTLLILASIQSVFSVNGLSALACREIFELTPFLSGTVLLVSVIIGIFIPLFASKIDKIINENNLLFIGCIIMSTSQLLMVSAGHYKNLNFFIMSRLLFSCFAPLLLTKSTWIFLEEFGKDNEGYMSGLMQQTRYISGTICLAFASAIIFTGKHSDHLLSAKPFSISMCVPLVISLFPITYMTISRFSKRAITDS